MINKQSNEITELTDLIKSLTSELSTLKTLVPKITAMENKLSSTQESNEDDNELSENNSAPYVVASSERSSNITRQKPKCVPLQNSESTLASSNATKP